MTPHDDVDLALIHAADVEVDFGAELLDEDDQVVDDISADLEDGKVDWSADNEVFNTCDIQLLRPLDWNSARVRLFQTLSATAIGSRRYDLGVFVLTTPDENAGEDPITFDVQGYDKNHLLQHRIGDTYYIPAGTKYLAAAQQAIIDSGISGTAASFDLTAAGKVLPEPMVWHGTVETDTTWLEVINQILKAAGYEPLWVDGRGVFRSSPLLTAADRASEFVLDTTDDATDIVEVPRTFTPDTFDEVNHWTFIRADFYAQPAEGSGLYTVDRTAGAYRRPLVVTLTAADQASLVAQGDQQVADDTQRLTTWALQTGPLPIAGHNDVLTLVDRDRGRFKLSARSRSIPLRDGPVSLTLEVV